MEIAARSALYSNRGAARLTLQLRLPRRSQLPRLRPQPESRRSRESGGTVGDSLADDFAKVQLQAAAATKDLVQGPGSVRAPSLAALLFFIRPATLRARPLSAFRDPGPDTPPRR